MYKTIASSTLRQNLAEVLDSLKKDGKYLVVRRGKPVAGIVDIDLFEDLLALSSPSYLKSIKEAREDYKKGKFSTLDEVIRDLEY